MDEEAFDAFYRASYGRLVGQIYAMCGNAAEAEDCVQDAFIRAWDHRKDFADNPRPEGWVRTVAYRLSVSRWRRHRRHVALDTEPAHADPADGQLTKVALQQALAELPDNQRRAVVLHYLAGLSVAEIADEMDAAPGSVKSWLFRGRERLGQYFARSDRAERGST